MCISGERCLDGIYARTQLREAGRYAGSAADHIQRVSFVFRQHRREFADAITIALFDAGAVVAAVGGGQSETRPLACRALALRSREGQ